jgi:uncharacterized protein YceK
VERTVNLLRNPGGLAPAKSSHSHWRWGTLLLLPLISGCGTLEMLKENRVDVYGGVRGDLWLLGFPVPALGIAFFAVDAPLSFAADTVLLPISIPIRCTRTPESKESSRNPERNQPEEGKASQAVPAAELER